MKTQLGFTFMVFAFITLTAFGQETIPTGTIIPVALSGSLSSAKLKPGAPIHARVMQDVPLPRDREIREGTKITGRVVDVKPSGPNADASISLKFDRVLTSKEGLPVTTDLRAIASFVAVNNAMIPAFGMGEGDSWRGRTTMQIGGDVVYWGGGPVVSRVGRVGKPLTGADSGVLVRITAPTGGPCRGETGETNRLQAMWVFSSDACGVYDLNGLSIDHAGRDNPLGVIELSSRSKDLKLHSGTGMLLRITAQ
jgi:hypothetical protein